MVAHGAIRVPSSGISIARAPEDVFKTQVCVSLRVHFYVLEGLKTLWDNW